MNHLLSRLSKPALVALSLIGGLLFIIVLNPPHDLCSTQLETFKEEMEHYLFINKTKQKKNKEKLKSGFQKDFDYCQSSNNIGGCYEFFFNLRNTLRSFDAVSNECKPSIVQLREVKETLWETAELMVKIAWGGKPPKGIYDKYSWMDTSDMSLFCHIKQLIQDLYPDKEWGTFFEQMRKELPGANQLSRKRTWELMILSDNCAQF